MGPIPDSLYCFRLWPGPASLKHYYLDFVHANNPAKAVNSPLEFSLWMPMPSIKSLPSHLIPLPSLEERMGVRREDIRDGEERFVLVEGQDCFLRRPGLEDVAFTVPIRPVPHMFAVSIFCKMLCTGYFLNQCRHPPPLPLVDYPKNCTMK